MDLKKCYLDLVTEYHTEHTEAVNQAWARIERNYGEKFRYYHNFEHLDSMLMALQSICHAVVHPEDTQLAIFYHDLAYDPVSSDNEEQSAEAAQADLRQFDFPAERIDRIVAYILATKDHQSVEDLDTGYLLDVDLAILGQAPARYQRYCQQIRLEYAMFADPIYRAGRRKVLQSFLNRPHIYNTSYFQERLEQQAKRNLETEIRSL